MRPSSARSQVTAPMIAGALPVKLIVLGFASLSAAAALVLGAALRWRRGTRAVVARLRAAAAAPLPAIVPRELDGLPPPVARYFREALPERPTPIAYARLEQRGRFRLRPGPDGWRPFTATEHLTAHPAGFVWDACIRVAPGMHVMVRDAFVEGAGSMVGSVMGLRRVVSVEGTRAISAGALQRYLAEAVWIPTALLPSAGVAWKALGPSSARATLTAGATTVSVDFYFGADGLVERIYTAARERDIGGGRSVPTPWQGRFSRYDVRDGVRIPLAGEVEWILLEGPQPYWRGEITSITFERALDLTPFGTYDIGSRAARSTPASPLRR